MSKWKTGEKLIDEVESDWRKRIDNCAQVGFHKITFLFEFPLCSPKATVNIKS